jgi:hypothetical protein
MINLVQKLRKSFPVSEMKRHPESYRVRLLQEAMSLVQNQERLVVFTPISRFNLPAHKYCDRKVLVPVSGWIIARAKACDCIGDAGNIATLRAKIIRRIC